ncbi:Hypothetical predicted protein [Cloeon dipterum]|uniref:Uncharacterized protein n=1 Tax=Cloeon dipterum TaxID=197152 RepID=A0A8S1DR87_9INSE|nr:Hypothetical predicted protein [Cloeon dipterum]
MPEPSCCSRPAEEAPGEPDRPRQADVRRDPPDLIELMLDDNKNGTLLEVFGIDPPCKNTHDTPPALESVLSICTRGGGGG